MDKEIKNAAEALENWLADPHELGHKPYKVEYTNQFEDEDGICCMIFKYKPSLLGKWYLGIVSESGTFSEMKEYHRESERKDAEEILTMLKNYWKNMAKQMGRS